jgi:hypothetical protein
MPAPPSIRNDLASIAKQGLSRARNGPLTALRNLRVVKRIKTSVDISEEPIYAVIRDAISHHMSDSDFGRAAYPILGIGDWFGLSKGDRDKSAASMLGISPRTLVRPGNLADQVIDSVADALRQYETEGREPAYRSHEPEIRPSPVRWLELHTSLRWTEANGMALYRLRYEGRCQVEVPALRFFERSYRWTGLGRETEPTILGHNKKLHGPVVRDDEWRLFIIDLGRTYLSGQPVKVGWEITAEEPTHTMTPWLQHFVRASISELTLSVTPPSSYSETQAHLLVIDPATDMPIEPAKEAKWTGSEWIGSPLSPQPGYKYRLQWEWN